MAIAVAALLYFADEMTSRFRPRGSIQVDVFYSVARKDNRIDYIKGDPQMEECVNSFAPHVGLRPCWFVSRHPRKEIDVGIQHNDFWRF